MFSHQKEDLAQTRAIAYGGTVNFSENSPTILGEILQKAATTE
ncbi:hypothetical protein [Okeania sp. KiyG1]|nr:hypothetical protein [Okeania sp. KiyG1]